MTQQRIRVIAAAAALAAASGVAACGGGGDGEAAAAPAAATAAAAAAQTPAGSGSDTPTIVAQGVGEVSARPDTLTVSLGIHTQAATATQALDENNLRTQALLDAIAAQGIVDDDVQTSRVSVGPTYGGERFERITGYQVDNMVTVELHDLERAGAIVDELVRVGGDNIRLDGLSFSIDDPTAALADARTEAVQKARDQAEQLAEAAGVALGKVRTISEVPRGFNEDPYALTGAAADAAFERAPVPLAPGTQDLSMVVTVVYEIDQ